MKSYVRFLHRARFPLAALFLALFVFCLLQIRHLELKSDFRYLLPETAQSVVDLERIAKRVPGTGSLIVAVEGKNQDAMMRFADDFVKKIRALPAGYVDSVEYNVSEVRRHYEDNKYLYMSLPDLRAVKERLDRSLQREKLKAAGFFIDLDEENSGFDTKDIEAKYREKAGSYDQYAKGYFFNKEQDLLVILLRPPGEARGVEFSRDLVSRVQVVIANLNPAAYDPSLRIGLTGKLRRILFEYQALTDDIVLITGLCLGLIALCALVYYRRLRMVFLMAWSVVNGAVWTFALVKGHIGYVTMQTAFLASILVANGVNYSLILMARYLEERRKGLGIDEALETSVSSTLGGTLASALTTSLAFATLLTTQIKGYSHFGYIGGLGMFFCWVAAYTVLPVFMSLADSMWSVTKADESPKGIFAFTPLLADRLASSWARPLTGFGLAITLVSIPLIVSFAPRSLEYDFSKLRIKPKSAEVADEAYWNRRIDGVFGHASAPAVLLTDRIEQARVLCDEILKKNSEDPLENRVVDNCQSVYSYLPEDQDEKLRILNELRVLLQDKSLRFLNPGQRKELEAFKRLFAGRKLQVHDLPESILKNFREKNGTLGNIVFVYSSSRASLWDGKNLIRFAQMIRSNTLPNGDVITGSGDSVILADMFQAMRRDGPRAALLAFGVVCLMILLIFREKRAAYAIVGTLSLGSVWMFGVLALLGIKINFFNFIAIPVTFGVAIDYGCNLYQRYREEGKGSMGKALTTTGGAVALCSLTTIIGYSILILSKNQALASFGWIAVIGELSCLFAALCVVPALMVRFEHRRRHAS